MNASNALNESQHMLRIYSEYYLRRWKNILKKKHKHFPDAYDLRSINKQDSLTKMTEHLLLQYTEFDSVEKYLKGYSITGECLSSLSVDSHVYITNDDPIIPSHDYTNLHPSNFLNIHLTEYGGHCGFLNSMFNINWIDNQIIKQLTETNQE